MSGNKIRPIIFRPSTVFSIIIIISSDSFSQKNNHGFNPAKLKRTAKSKELIKEGEIFPWQKRIRQRITACMSIGSTNEIISSLEDAFNINLPAWFPGLSSSSSVTSSKIMRGLVENVF